MTKFPYAKSIAAAIAIIHFVVSTSIASSFSHIIQKEQNKASYTPVRQKNRSPQTKKDFIDQKNKELQLQKYFYHTHPRAVKNNIKKSLNEANRISNEIYHEIKRVRNRRTAAISQHKAFNYTRFRDGHQVFYKDGLVDRVENQRIVDERGNVSIQRMYDMVYDSNKLLIGYKSELVDADGNVTRTERSDITYTGDSKHYADDDTRAEQYITGFKETRIDELGRKSVLQRRGMRYDNASNLTYYEDELLDHQGIKTNKTWFDAQYNKDGEITSYREQGTDNLGNDYEKRWYGGSYIRNQYYNEDDEREQQEFLLTGYTEEIITARGKEVHQWRALDFNEYGEVITSQEHIIDRLGIASDKIMKNAEYDKRGRIISYLEEIMLEEGIIRLREWKNARYDKQGNLLSYYETLTDPDGKVTTKNRLETEYDDQGRIIAYKEKTTDPRGNSSEHYWFDARYDDAGMLIGYVSEITDDTGVFTTTWTGAVYDRFGNVVDYTEMIFDGAVITVDGIATDWHDISWEQRNKLINACIEERASVKELVTITEYTEQVYNEIDQLIDTNITTYQRGFVYEQAGDFAELIDDMWDINKTINALEKQLEELQNSVSDDELQTIVDEAKKALDMSVSARSIGHMRANRLHAAHHDAMLSTLADLEKQGIIEVDDEKLLMITKGPETLRGYRDISQFISQPLLKPYITIKDQQLFDLYTWLEDNNEKMRPDSFITGLCNKGYIQLIDGIEMDDLKTVIDINKEKDLKQIFADLKDKGMIQEVDDDISLMVVRAMENFENRQEHESGAREPDLRGLDTADAVIAEINNKIEALKVEYGDIMDRLSELYDSVDEYRQEMEDARLAYSKEEDYLNCLTEELQKITDDKRDGFYLTENPDYPQELKDAFQGLLDARTAYNDAVAAYEIAKAENDEEYQTLEANKNTAWGNVAKNTKIWESHHGKKYCGRDWSSNDKYFGEDKRMGRQYYYEFYQIFTDENGNPRLKHFRQVHGYNYDTEQWESVDYILRDRASSWEEALAVRGHRYTHVECDTIVDAKNYMEAYIEAEAAFSAFSRTDGDELQTKNQKSTDYDQALTDIKTILKRLKGEQESVVADKEQNFNDKKALYDAEYDKLNDLEDEAPGILDKALPLYEYRYKIMREQKQLENAQKQVEHEQQRTDEIEQAKKDKEDALIQTLTQHEFEYNGHTFRLSEEQARNLINKKSIDVPFENRKMSYERFVEKVTYKQNLASERKTKRTDMQYDSRGRLIGYTDYGFSPSGTVMTATTVFDIVYNTNGFIESSQNIIREGEIPIPGTMPDSSDTTWIDKEITII
ncbi:MAG: hypothetical protein GF384_00960, partial [Elusimicrobia bacterium]|nr:hypothetical protein [Elusimicrobiota bacterium]MBD3411623.1 hypothetical protein [Elusimicrobiota bacterium]